MILAAGCTGDSDSPLSAGDAFVDAHYVRIDLEASKSLCRGVALQKVEKEIALTSDIEIEQDTQRPRINFTVHEERALGDAVQLIYKLVIRAPGLDPYDKYTIVTVRSEDGKWMVTNYMEMDSL